MDKNALLTKLKSYEKGTQRRSVDINASFSTLTDEEILLVMAHRAKKLRIQNNLKQSTFSKSANLSSASTYSNFEQNGKVSLINFIKIVRSFGQIAVFENVLKSDISAVIEAASSGGKIKKRVR